MSTLKDIYIIGAGGFGKEVAWLIERINKAVLTWNLKGFIDDNKMFHGRMQSKYPVLGDCSMFYEIPDKVWVICAVGCSQTRKIIIEKLKNCPKVRFATLIDPDVLCSEYVSIEEGSIICAGTKLTVDVSVGSHAIINLNCTIGHDTVIHDFVTINPGANISGCATIGEAVELGTGIQVLQGKKICAGSIIGAGAVVVRDIIEEGIYVGVPARKRDS